MDGSNVDWTLMGTLSNGETLDTQYVEDGATKLMRLIDTLDEHDDVNEVFANFDVDADVLARVAG